MAKQARKNQRANRIIPITKPFIGREEEALVKQVLRSGWLTQGPKVKQFEGVFASCVGSKYACAVSSCTAALHLALIAVGVKPGDVVITVSHSFIATANSIRYCGAEPIFVDIELGTYNMSIKSVKKCLYYDCKYINGKLFYKNTTNLATGESPLRYLMTGNESGATIKSGRVAAILVVHQMGMPCDLGAILSLAGKFNIPVIEDAACAIGSEIRINSKWEKIGKPHGDIACFSFHPRKLITTGEGGMLTTNNQNYDKLFRLLRQHGMGISDRIRHSLKKVVFEEYLSTGYNYRLTDIQAAMGIEQMKRLPGIIKERRKIARIYREGLADIDWIEAPIEPDYCKTNWQSYAVKVKVNAPFSRNKLMQYLLNNGISTRRGIMNAHQEKPYIRMNFNLPNSELARDTIVLLPLFCGKDCNVERIIKYLYNAVKYL